MSRRIVALSISASSTTACCQHSHRLFEDGEDVTYTFTFRIFSALNANAVIKVIFPPEFNSLGVNPSVHAISGIVSSTSASGLLEGEIHENTMLISGFDAINAETLITIEIRHVQNPPFRSFPSDSQITYVENGICLSDDSIKIGKYDTEEACKESVTPISSVLIMHSAPLLMSSNWDTKILEIVRPELYKTMALR